MARLAESVANGGTRQRFAVSHRPAEAEGWLELVASGLTFDLLGLAPAASAATPLRRHSFGLGESQLGLELHAVCLLPGPHLAGGEALLPVVRVMTGLAATLSSLPGVVALAWHPAGTWVERDYFARSVSVWLAGGAFPASGLTALADEAEGGLCSEGLAFFTGQELQIEQTGETQAERAKLAVRLIHRLVEAGPLAEEIEFLADDGGEIAVVPSPDGRSLTAKRRQ